MRPRALILATILLASAALASPPRERLFVSAHSPASTSAIASALDIPAQRVLEFEGILLGGDGFPMSFIGRRTELSSYRQVLDRAKLTFQLSGSGREVPDPISGLTVEQILCQTEQDAKDLADSSTWPGLLAVEARGDRVVRVSGRLGEQDHDLITKALAAAWEDSPVRTTQADSSYLWKKHVEQPARSGFSRTVEQIAKPLGQ